MTKEPGFQSMAASPRILTHTLQRISLVNWYLFRVQDMDIAGRSVLITGRNGAGKSTILDAIQTILAGADENKLSYNAIANDGASVTRSLKSYCLGEVGENDGGDDSIATRARTLANTYISLTWNNRGGTCYSFGCGFYARKDSKKVDKHFFLIKGYELSSRDYMQDEHTVIPWKDFERKLGTLGADVTICKSATEFRHRCCEAMSAVGASQAISPDALFRTIKKGLQFRQQKDVTAFIRDYILPERPIDVVSIENDYRQYVNLREEIEQARARLDMYQRVIASLEKYQGNAKKAVNYTWVAAEFGVSEKDLEVEQLRDHIDTLQQRKREIEGEQALIKAKIPGLEQAKDNALLQLNGSDLSHKIESLDVQIASMQKTLAESQQPIQHLRQIIQSLEALDLASITERDIKEPLNSGLKQLRSTANLNGDDLLQQWPSSADQLQATLDAVAALMPAVDRLQQAAQQCESQYSEADKELHELTHIYKKLEKGEASLQAATEKLIALLAQHNMVATPICDLAEVSDKEWQWGLERFLGVWNREALLIMDSRGQVADADLYEQALSIYRNEKERDKRLRSVKILNPEKIKRPRKAIEPNTAPSLIVSDSPEARYYLQGLLLDVHLVDSEADLRRARRAVTRDGMVAGNGAISGGNRIDFVLLGQGARKNQANQLMEGIGNLVSTTKRLKATKAALGQLSEAFSPLKASVVNQGESVIEGYQHSLELSETIETAQQTKQTLSADSDYDTLNVLYAECSEALFQCNGRDKALAGELGGVTEALNSQQNNLAAASHALDKSIAIRRDIETDPLYDAQEAANAYQQLEDADNTRKNNLAAEAQTKAKHFERRSAESRENASKHLLLLCERHDIEGKDRLVNLAPMALLEKCQQHARVIEESELVLYEQDARDCQESMLNHFRSGVVAKLQDSFNQLAATMRELNDALQGLHFNNFEFRFTTKEVKTPILAAVYDYATTINHINSDGGLFDEGQHHEGIRVIEEAIADNRLAEISDYRNFFCYDIAAKDIRSQVTRTYSELLGTGSEGEKQSPFYVALAASFVNAYKLNRYGSSMAGGAALALFDEAMSKMDGVNTSAALQFFNSLGLQILMAAPPETAVKVGTNIPTTMRVTRSGGVVYIDETEMTAAAKTLLESDDPRVYPDIAKPFEEAVREEFGVANEA